jgi:hypothetical protein
LLPAEQNSSAFPAKQLTGKPLMATPWTSLTEETNESEVASGPAHAKELFYDLGQVLERLWIFYEAMLRGTPVLDSDDRLSQIEAALRRVSTRQSGVGAGSQGTTSPQIS